MIENELFVTDKLAILIIQSVGLILFLNWKNLTQGIKNKNHSLWHWNWLGESFLNYIVLDYELIESLNLRCRFSPILK